MRTIGTTMRLKKETLNDLEVIAKFVAKKNGTAPNRTDAMRYAARVVAEQIKSQKSQGQVLTLNGQ